MQACIGGRTSGAQQDPNLLPTIQQPKAERRGDFAPTVQEPEAQQDNDPLSTVQRHEAQDHSFTPTVQELELQQDHEYPQTVQQLESRQDLDFAPTAQELEKEQDVDQQDLPDSNPDIRDAGDDDSNRNDDVHSESDNDVSDLEAYVDDRMARTSELLLLFSKEQTYLDQAADELAGRRLLAKQEADAIDALEAQDAEHSNELVELETWVDKLSEHYESGAASEFLDSPENKAFKAKLFRSDSSPVVGMSRMQQQLRAPVRLKRDSSLPASPTKLRQGIRAASDSKAPQSLRAPQPLKRNSAGVSMPGRVGPSDSV